MATKQNRGTKRTCQNSECGSRFYDLNRTPIACPICGA
ncbi:MAG: FYDLN acid domain-containing protein, partial [Hyphomicrobiaceae bacterium]|nr:FYDLN acid domain-containing protein [Hyphomicrobiaceae bacterium]